MVEIGIIVEENTNLDENKENLSDDQTNENQNNSSNEQNISDEENASNDESIESIPFIAEPSKEKRTRSNK